MLSKAVDHAETLKVRNARVSLQIIVNCRHTKLLLTLSKRKLSTLVGILTGHFPLEISSSQAR